MKIEHIVSILETQRTFFRSGQTRDIGYRREALKRLKAMIVNNEKLIMEALYKDLRKASFEAYSSEIGPVLKEIDLHLHNLKRWTKQKRKASPLVLFPARSYVRREPYGVALIMAPWNYPFGLMMTPLVGAISGGNCIVLKPADYSSATSAIIEKLITDTFAKEYISVFRGGRDVNIALLEQRYDYIFFTGSRLLGGIVAKKAVNNITPHTLELGGKSPCIVDKDANLKKTARRIVEGKFFNLGQTCIAPDHLYVHGEVKNTLIELIGKEITRQFGKNPQESPDLSRMINERAFDRVSSYLEDTKILIGGLTDRVDKYIAPTLIECKDEALPVMQEEIFGPVLPVLEFKDLDKLISAILLKEKPLALYYFSSNRNSIRKVLDKIDSGGVCINELLVHFINCNIPFGGVGSSGMGSYHGKYSFDTFSRDRALVVSPTLFDLPAKFAPYRNKVKLIKKIF